MPDNQKSEDCPQRNEKQKVKLICVILTKMTHNKGETKMKILASTLAIVLIVTLVLVISSASGVQTLTKNDLSSFVGAGCCKSSTDTPADCKICETKGNHSDICDDGDYTRRECKSGTPDNCTMTGSLTCCSGGTKFSNQNCSGEGLSFGSSCTRKCAEAASECD
jgi:hypothetical protein